jgi:DNA topoisomerase-1
VEGQDGAQEAHEAVRPTYFDLAEAGETDAERRLYDLIWERTMASQLADARYMVRKAVLLAAESLDQAAIRFDAAGRRRVFAGWEALAGAADDLADSDPDDNGENASNPVPVLQPGQILCAAGGRVIEKKTKPPPRFTEEIVSISAAEDGDASPFD